MRKKLYLFFLSNLDNTNSTRSVRSVFNYRKKKDSTTEDYLEGAWLVVCQCELVSSHPPSSIHRKSTCICLLCQFHPFHLSLDRIVYRSWYSYSRTCLCALGNTHMCTYRTERKIRMSLASLFVYRTKEMNEKKIIFVFFVES